MSDSLPFTAAGATTFVEKQQEERHVRAASVTVRMQCSDCGFLGHWRGDPD